MEIHKLVKCLMVLIILQWNARSLISNGQEFKRYIHELNSKPDVICIQETWLKPHLDFVLKGYISIRHDRRKERGGGCMTFVRDGISYRHLSTAEEHECIVIEIFNGDNGKYTVVNYYNPCKALTNELLGNIIKRSHRELWCGDFNAHNSLWGSKHTDLNGEAVEEMINDRMLVCLNNGSGTRINIYKNETSCIDLTLVDRKIASICEWEVEKNTSMGSDHFPIFCKIEIELKIEESYIHHKWHFMRADWEEFYKNCNEEIKKFPEVEQTIDQINNNLSTLILTAASKAIPISNNQKIKVNVPWWNDKCKEVIKNRNKAFKILRKTLTTDNLIEYQRKKTLARKVIKEVKRESWRQFCSTIGRETTLDKMWMMVKKMLGRYKPQSIPVLIDKNFKAISEKEKANMLGKYFADIHKGDHLDDCFKKRKEDILKANEGILNCKSETGSILDEDFNMSELKMAVDSTAYSSPGCDNLCYAMFRKLPEEVLDKILELFNKIWNEGKLPKIWKKATILPFPKPGKDSSNPGNYRPIALTSHLGKLMEKLVVGRLNYFLENKGLLKSYQTGFRRNKSTTDALVKLCNEVEKSLVMKEVMAAVFLDIEKAYDTMWREGLLIKLEKIGVSGKMFNYILDFLTCRSLRVRVGNRLSEEYMVESGIPQGSVISPILFNIMINDLFEKGGEGLLYADDAVVWKKGRNIPYIIGSLQKEIKILEQWGIDWGNQVNQKKSMSKSKVMFFTRKKVPEKFKVMLYNQPLERVIKFKYLGIFMDENLHGNII